MRIAVATPDELNSILDVYENEEQSLQLSEQWETQKNGTNFVRIKFVVR